MRFMHRSRVYALLIDTPAAEAAHAAAFWSAASAARPGRTPRNRSSPCWTRRCPDVVAVVQAVDDAPRLHLDIETDDVEAETARLLALGAVPVTQWLDCHVLRAPGGHLLCVIPVHSDPGAFTARATTWP